MLPRSLIAAATIIASLRSANSADAPGLSENVAKPQSEFKITRSGPNRRVPLAFLTTQTNLANLQAAESQHMSKAINPRLQRRDEKLNEQLIPIYDPTRRLFLASEDPSPVDPEATWQTMNINMQFGIVTINEARDAQGLPAAPWGDKPWLPDNQVQPK